MRANLHEIICSIQGEGILVGTKQVFLRTTKCNLRCSYCDTQASFNPDNFCLVYPEVGKSDRVKHLQNPVSVEAVADIVKTFQAPWLSFTGGEPLLEANFLKEVMLYLADYNCKFILETNGTLPEELEKVIDLLDYISMDIKLPSIIGFDYFDQHVKFLTIASQKPSYIKIIITSDYNMEEIRRALSLIKSVNPNIPLFLQPVTPGAGERGISIFEAISLQTYALKYINDVRILPQIHPWLGLT